MRVTQYHALVVLLILLLASAPLQAQQADGEKLFKKNCSSCHDLKRSGPWPAVKEFSRDLKTPRKAISQGVKLMPAYGGKLSVDEIEALIIYVQAQQNGAG